MATQEKVLRISQLDSLELDNELTNAMVRKFNGLLMDLPYSSLIERLKPELKIILKFLLWKFSLGGRKGCTFGQEMMSLTYKQQNGLELTSKHKWILLLLYIAPGWFTERNEDLIKFLFPQFSSSTNRTLCNFIKGILNIASLLNFCSFLLHGRYPSLKERCLRLQTTSVRPQTLRQLSFLYMNREILWYGFSEFLFTVLPLVNFRSLQNRARKLLYSYNIIKREEEEERSEGELKNTCVLCEMELILPQLAYCGHVFCYYCVAANVQADRSFPCPYCNRIVTPYTHYYKKIN